MIIVDTSALVAMFLGEDYAASVEDVLARAHRAYIPVSCIAEIAVLTRMGERRFEWLDTLLVRTNFQTVSVEAEAASLAVQAARRFGKGSGHPAQLNFGDCLSYAVAKYRDLPLLFVGDNFRHTDVTPALASG